MKKIGILGGTFNPIHIAHICVAQTAQKKFDLDEVWLMPSGAPPHKDNKELAKASFRCQMILLAIQGHDKLRLCDIEINSQKQKEKTYTADTLQMLHDQYPKDQFYFILGGDAILKFDFWVNPSKIVELSTILVCGRAGEDQNRINEKISRLNQSFHCQMHYFDVPKLSISSKKIREALRKKNEIEDMHASEDLHEIEDMHASEDLHEIEEMHAIEDLHAIEDMHAIEDLHAIEDMLSPAVYQFIIENGLYQEKNRM